MSALRILIIGGSGIISGEVCSRALSQGMEVTILNRGRRKQFMNPQAEHIKADVKNESCDEIRKKLIGKKFDAVLDFLSYKVEDMEKIFSVIYGICRQYIFISSATVYCEQPKGHVYRESDAIGNSLWEYSLRKSECEWYLEKNKIKNNFEYSIVRPYVTYGVTRIPYQIAPIEYYTIIHRILNEKPVLISGINTKCTVTWAKEFAVGVAGLIGNPKAYGNAVHITASKSTQWKEIIEILASFYHKKAEFADINCGELKKRKYPGFDLEEVEGDKGRDMVFDNSKIRELVPDFKGDISFGDAVADIVDFYDCHAECRKINYIWDGRIDLLLCRYYKKHKMKIPESLSLGANLKNGSAKDKISYLIGRWELLYRLGKKIKRQGK